MGPAAATLAAMSARHAGLLAALAAIWGGSYLLIKYGLEDLAPAVIVWLRCVLAAVVLFAVLALRAAGARRAPRWPSCGRVRAARC